MFRYGIRAATASVVLVISLCVVAPRLALAGKRCTYDAQACLDHIVEKYRKRGWMGVEIEMNEETGTITIIHVHPNAPADKAGLRVGDLIIEADGVPLSAKTLMNDKSIDEKMVPGAKIVFTLQRDGKTFKAPITLIATPDFIVARFLGRHMIKHADFYPEEDEEKTE